MIHLRRTVRIGALDKRKFPQDVAWCGKRLMTGRVERTWTSLQRLAECGDCLAAFAARKLQMDGVS